MGMFYEFADGTRVDCDDAASTPEKWDSVVMSRSGGFWWRFEVKRTPALAFALLFLAEVVDGRYSKEETVTRYFANNTAEAIFRLRHTEVTLDHVFRDILSWIGKPSILEMTRIEGHPLTLAREMGFESWDTIDGPSLIRYLQSPVDAITYACLAESFRIFPDRYIMGRGNTTLMRMGGVFVTPWQREHERLLGLMSCRCVTCRRSATDCDCEAEHDDARLGPPPTDLDLLAAETWGNEARHKRARITFPRSRGTKAIPRFVGVEIEITAARNPELFYEFATATGAGIKGDGSLPFGEESFELILPPRKGAQFDEMLGALRDVFARTRTMVTQHCGLHVHVDARRLVETDLQNVARAWYAHENEFLAKHVSKKRRGNRYCREWASVLSRGTPPDFAAMRLRDGYFSGLNAISGDRYLTLNTTAYKEHKTLEVRAYSWDDFPHTTIGGFRTSFIDATNADAAVAHIRAKASAAARFVQDAKRTDDPSTIEV